MNTTMNAAHFSWVDHTMFAMMLLLSTVVGVLIGVCSKQDTRLDYLLGGKKMKVLPVAVSLIFSHISGVTMVGLPTEYYTYGSMFYYQNVAGFLCCALTVFVLLPIFFDLQMSSTYEYLELRFDQKVRTMASFLYALNTVLYMPVVIYVPALAFNQVSGLSIHLITTVVCGICVLYTMLGGLKAVVWTDFLQSFITVGSGLAVVTLGLVKLGGFQLMWDRSSKGGRLEFFDYDPSPLARNTLWTVIIGNSFHWMASFGVDPGMVQKFISLPSLRNARMSVLIFYCGFLVMKTMSFLSGLIMYSIYYECDPISSKLIEKSDQMLPFFTMDTASHIPGLPGLFVAGIFSAGLSSLSSNLNCLSATIYDDLVSPLIAGNKYLESKTPFFLKSIVFFAGIVCILMVFVVEQFGGIVQVSVSLSGVTEGAMLGMFLLGMFFPWANPKGCLAGSIVSLVTMAWIVTGAKVYKATGVERFPYLPSSTEGCERMFNITLPAPPSPSPLPEGMGDDAFVLYKVSFHYYCLMGTFIVIVVGLFVSYLTGLQDTKTLDQRLLAPCVKKYASCCTSDAQRPEEVEMLNAKNHHSDN